MKLSLVLIGVFLVFASKAQKTEIFTTDGIALSGYDVVSFFDEKPVKGIETNTLQWKGVIWLFSTSDNLQKFKQNPEHYEPQYGGWCAYGASKGYKAPTMASTWALLNNKLYFNYNMKVRNIWDENRQTYIDSADYKWPFFKDK